MRRALTIAATITTVVTSAVFVTAGSAAADPSANDWLQLRMCESTNRYDINTGNGYYGAYQFDLSTWRSVGGSGYPNDASPAEQDLRALMLYRDRGWEPWTCAGLVGLREDSDANTGVAPPVAGNQSSGGGASEAREGAGRRRREQLCYCYTQRLLSGCQSFLGLGRGCGCSPPTT